MAKTFISFDTSLGVSKHITDLVGIKFFLKASVVFAKIVQ